MKLRIKYTNTQKFTVEVEELTFGNLKNLVSRYVSTTYGKELNSFSLSFNGKEPIIGNESTTLSSLGIVNGDLLVVIPQTTSTTGNSSSVSLTSLPKSSTSLPQEANKGKSRAMSLEGSNICGANAKVTNLLEARDGSSPPDLVFALFNRYSPTSVSDALNILIHITIIEAGYVLGEPLASCRSLPSCWKDIAVTFKYHNPRLQNFACTIVVVTMGSVKQVLASFPGQESEISVRLESKDYFLSNEILPHRLTKLSHLARLVRNELLYPLQVAAHSTLGLPAPWHLVGLPQELLVLIGSHLNLRSVLMLSSTCKRLEESMVDNKLWYNLFKRDFKKQYHHSDTISGADWRAKYRAAHEQMKKDRKEKPVYDVLYEDFMGRRGTPPMPGGIPAPNAPPYYPHIPDPIPNPYRDPDSPYFGGEIPHPYGPYIPMQPDPFDPFGNGNPLGPSRPRRPHGPNPLLPPVLPPRFRNPRGPRFDFF